MKKKLGFLSLILFILTIAIFVFVYGFSELIIDDKIREYLNYLALALLVCALASTISQIIQRRYIRHADALEKRLSMWNSISYKVKKGGETAFNKLPIGIMVITDNYEVIWSNEFAQKIFKSRLEKMFLQNINQELQNGLASGKIKFNCPVYGMVYEVQYEKEHNVLYFTNITRIVEIEELYKMRTLALGYINIDNLEEALSDFDVQARAQYMSTIIGMIATWAEEFGVYVRAYSDNHYIILMDHAQLLTIMKSNFRILDDVKQVIRINTVARLSISIGLACHDIPVEELANVANDQLEHALNRGGDQVVVKINDETFYFGAKTDTAPRESKVFTRMKSQELQGLIKNSSKILIMGHKDLDADGFGATLALYKMVKTFDKEAYIILNRASIDATVSRIYESIEREYVSLCDDIITSTDAQSILDDETLLMVVDCQSGNLVMDDRLVKKAKKIGIIDHHRKGDTTIDNYIYYYNSTAASSSVELIVELYEFVKDEVELDTLEATWMLLGMIVDTNNFVYRTSQNTFDVAARLAKYGADMTGVKRYLKEDISEKLARNEFIDNLEIYRERVGISIGRLDLHYERAALAKISDEIISITGVEVGITIGYLIDGKIGVSARSLGVVNVQILMEKLGGGGHFNNAATQIDATKYSLEQVSNIIKEYIDEYFEKEETMKVILTKEVKNRGKKGDIIDLQPGFANHLVRVGQAVLASPENIKVFEAERYNAELEAERFLQEMKELKNLVESQSIQVAVKVGSEGKIFGSVSMKQVVDEFKNKTGISLDKRKINYDENLQQLGTYKIPIQLHKDVTATIIVHVIERG